MRREFARFVGYSNIVGLNGSAWSTTTNVTTATTMLVISTELRNAGFDDYGQSGAGDDSLENLWVLLLGTNNAQTERPAKAYDASAGQLSLAAGSALSAESGSSDFELHRYRPSYLRDLMNDGRLGLFPFLHLPLTRYLATAQQQVRYDVPSAIVRGPDNIWLYKGIPTTHANNILSNADFQTWTNSTTVANWTATTLDVAEEAPTTAPFNYATIDGSAVRATSQSSNTGTLLQSISSPSTHSGQRISFQVWVYCLTADIVSTAIKIASTTHLGTAADGGLHKGTGWELLTHYEDSTVTISSLDVGISVVSSATDNSEFYIDSAVCVVGPLRAAETRPTKLMNWEYREDMQGTTLRQYVTFPSSFPDNYLLRFEGKGYLSSLSAEGDTMEVGKPQSDLLYAWMANELYEQYVADVPDADRTFNQQRLASAARRLDDLQIHAMRTPRVKMNIPDMSYSSR